MNWNGLSTRPERLASPTLMSLEAEAETFGKGRHLGHRNHLAAGAAQHHDMGVVDHDPLHRSSAEVAQGLGQEDLAVEALEGGYNWKNNMRE